MVVSRMQGAPLMEVPGRAQISEWERAGTLKINQRAIFCVEVARIWWSMRG
jgi:hypothetical protein